MSALANMLTDKRMREGLSLRDVSLRCGISFSTLSRIERGFEATAKNERILHAWLNGEAPILPPPPMTLRDYFAGQALAGLMANPSHGETTHGPAKADGSPKGGDEGSVHDSGGPDRDLPNSPIHPTTKDKDQ